MRSKAHHPWQGARAALATMHGKERAMALPLSHFLDIDVHVPRGIDTDVFGTFTREVPREGTALDAARAKARHALALDRNARLGIGSEGSFGPDPQLHFVPAGQELIVVIDRDSDLELIGQHLCRRTNFMARMVHSVDAALEIAQRVRFPSHGLVVMGVRDEQPDPTLLLEKGIHDPEVLRATVTTALARHGAAHVETDMRAHHNPTRMRAIRRATLDLVRRYRSCCPDCGRPGYGIVAMQSGLPCVACSAPTVITRARLWRCDGCRGEMMVPSRMAHADPRYCDYCNP